MPPFRFLLSAFRFPLSLAAFLLGACADPLPTEPSESAEPSRILALSEATCAQGNFAQFSAAQWDCGQQVEFYTGVASLQFNLASAVGAWRTRLAATGFTDLPTFQTTSIPGEAEATATGTGVGDEFCGSWTQSTKTIEVKSSATCGADQSTGSLLSLLQHEVGHAVGWVGGNVHKYLPAHCAMHLPDDRTINGNICTHEVEGVLAGYGLVSYSEAAFVSTPFVVGSVTSLAQATLEIGDTIRLTPGAYRLELGGTVPGTETNYSWQSTAHQVATVADGLVTAVGPGSATISAKPLAITGFLLAHPFRRVGVSTAITVQAPPPPPPPPPVAPEIRLDQVPVWDEGNHTFTYVGPGTPGALTWYIDDSRTIGVEPDTSVTTTGWTLTLYISAGSYNLRVSAAGISQDFPVCTRNAGANLLDDGGGAGTEAVTNCPPPDTE